MARRSSRYGVMMNEVPKFVRNLSNIGINYDIIAQTKSKTFDEDEDLFGIQNNGVLNGSQLYQSKLEEENPYYAQSYEEKRRYLRKFSGYSEIEYILDCVCDDCVIPNEYNHYCDPIPNRSKLLPAAADLIESNFNKIYSMLDFDVSGVAWNKFREWLIDGVIAYEIVYDYKNKSEINQQIIDLKNQLSSLNSSYHSSNNKGKKAVLEQEISRKNKKLRKIETSKSIFENYRCVNKDTNEMDDDMIPVRIIGFVELDPKYLTPIDVEDTSWKKSSNLKLWRYDRYKDGRDIILSENQLVYVNYYDNNTTGNISYVERLVRNFNLKRKLEDSVVGWFIMNCQSRLKMIVPIGNKTTDKAKQALRNLTNHYQEDLIVDFNTGEVKINGQARISYSRNIVLPSRSGSTPSIDTLNQTGPDLSNMKVVDYFDKNLRKDSRLPTSRYDRDKADGKVVLFKADNVSYEDLSYHAFTGRMQSIFSETLLKPVRIQCILDMPELKVDPSFKTSIGIEYYTNFLFNEAKDAEIMRAKLDIIRLYDNVKDDNDQPVFSKKYLFTQKYKILTEEEWDNNKDMIEKEKMDREEQE